MSKLTKQKGNHPYAFEVIENQKEFFEALHELNISLTPAQLKAPTPADVRRTMIEFIEILFGKSYDVFVKNNSVHECPQELFALSVEQYEQAMIEVDIIKHIQLLMEGVGIFDFTLNDLMYPSSKRFYFILCGLINFAKFRDVEAHRYQELVAQVEEIENYKSHLAGELANNMEQLRHYQELLDKEEPIIQSLENETREMAQRIQQLCTVQTVLSNERKHLKTIHEENEQKIKNDTEALAQLQSECSNLRNQIVRNPEQLKQRIEELKQEIISGKAELEVTQAKTQDCNIQLDSVKKVTEGVEKVVKTLQEYAKEKQRYQDLKAMNKQKRLAIADKQEKYSDLQTAEKHLTRQIQMTTEKIERTRYEHEQKMSHLLETLNDAIRNKNAVEEANEQIKNHINNNRLLEDEMRARMEQEKKKHLQRMVQIQNQYFELESLVRNYNRQLFESAGIDLRQN
jgi:hypothetical protein